jgi:hypothetical protein
MSLTTDIRDYRDINHERKRDLRSLLSLAKKNPFNLCYLCSDKNSAALRSTHRDSEAA